MAALLVSSSSAPPELAGALSILHAASQTQLQNLFHRQSPWRHSMTAQHTRQSERAARQPALAAVHHLDKGAPSLYWQLHWDIIPKSTGRRGALAQDDPAFVAAWKGCSAATAVRHLDVEAPQLFRALHRMELRGAWRGDQVPACLFSHTAHRLE